MGIDRRFWTLVKNNSIDKLKLTGYSETRTVAIKGLIYDSAGDVLLATGTGVPTDTADGYAKGCLFIDTDVGAGTSGLYVNIGTNSSANFNLVTNAAD